MSEALHPESAIFSHAVLIQSLSQGRHWGGNVAREGRPFPQAILQRGGEPGSGRPTVMRTFLSGPLYKSSTGVNAMSRSLRGSSALCETYSTHVRPYLRGCACSQTPPESGEWTQTFWTDELLKNPVDACGLHHACIPACTRPRSRLPTPVLTGVRPSGRPKRRLAMGSDVCGKLADAS
ncbi:hypothetical protein ABW21_db0203621 [Orbilia brochopaga]|nr:hypothetical protein ABW21_db0203621 [Drechslerella brochopaga]